MSEFVHVQSSISVQLPAYGRKKTEATHLTNIRDYQCSDY